MPLRQQRARNRRVGGRANAGAPAAEPAREQRRLDLGRDGDHHRAAVQIRRGEVVDAAGNGTVTLKVAPSPGALSTAMRPFMRSTMRLEIASPRPVPPYLRVEEPSACSNSRKMRAW